MKCWFCGEDRNPFVNNPKHKLYGMCEVCFNHEVEPRRNYRIEDNKK
jgi:hypothetical protein